MRLFDLSNLSTPPLNWLYKPWLERNALTVIVGAGGAGKSYLMVDAAIALASGQPWLGIDGTKSPARVLFIDEDGPEAELARRLERLCNGRDLSPADLSAFLFIAPSSGLRLDDPVGYASLANLIADRKIEYVIMDALIALHSLDENKTSDMRLLMRGLIRRLMRETGVGVAALHHEARPGNPKTSAPRIGAFKGRGSTEIINAGDAQLHVACVNGDHILSTSRNRILPVDEWPEAAYYHIRSHGNATFIVNKATDPTVPACMDIIRNLAASGMTIGSVRDTHKLLSEHGFVGSKNTVWRAITNLRTSGRL